MDLGGDRPGWVPLVDGVRRDLVMDAVRSLAERLRAMGDHDEIRGSDLATGRPGVALFFSDAARAGVDEGGDNMTATLLERSVEEGPPPGAGLFDGVTGLAWVLSHLVAPAIDSGDDDPCDTVDESLLEHLGTPTTGDDGGAYDLVGGLVGIGVYALARLPRPVAWACLDLVVTRLAERAETVDGGRTWFTPPELLSMSRRRQAPHGFYDCGVAHGVPGAIAFLADAARAGVPAAGPLSEKSLRWLLAQRLPAGSRSVFPRWVARGIGPVATRPAWCYGDPGVALMLLRAGMSEEAVRVAHRAVAEDKKGPPNSGLCHGAAGLAHLYNRLWQHSGDEALRGAAVSYLDRCLQLLDGNPDPGFLEGVGGAGLALVAAATDLTPEWDSVLLLSSPREGQA